MRMKKLNAESGEPPLLQLWIQPPIPGTIVLISPTPINASSPPPTAVAVMVAWH